MEDTIDEVFRESLDGLRENGQKKLFKLVTRSDSSRLLAARELLEVAEDIEKLVRTWIIVKVRNAGKEE